MNGTEIPAPDGAARPRRKTLRRWLRGVMWFFVILIGGLLLVREYVDWSGRRHWAAVRGMLNAEGESLDFGKIAPEPVPDDENFCAIPALKNLAAIPQNADPGTPDGARRARLMAVLPSSAAVVDLMKDRNVADFVPRPGSSQGASFGKPEDLAAWTAWLRFAGWLPKAAGPNPARDVLAALSRNDSLVNELAAGVDLPESQWTPAWTARGLPPVLMDMTYPEFVPTQVLASMLSLRSTAAARMGDAGTAHKSLLVEVRLNEAAMKEPFVIGTLVACGVSALISNTVWELCDAHCGDAGDFHALQEALSRLDYHKSYLLASRGELAFMANSFSYIESRPNRPFGINLWEPGLIRTTLDIVSNGWLEQNEAAMSEWRYDYYIKPLRDGNLGDLLASQAALIDLVAKHKSNYYNTFSEYLSLIEAPAFFGVTYDVIYAQSLVNESIAACALERYRIEHGAYPDTLDAANRAGEQPIPLDVISGKPMGYRKTPDGRYVLWCVALNGTDHGGKRVLDPAQPSSAQFARTDYAGDWVWSFSAN